MSDQNKTTQKRRLFSHQKMGLTHKHGGFKPPKIGLNRIQSWNIMNITHVSVAYWIRCHSNPGNFKFRMIELWLNYWITMELYTCKCLLLAKGTACRKPSRFWRSNRGVNPNMAESSPSIPNGTKKEFPRAKTGGSCHVAHPTLGKSKRVASHWTLPTGWPFGFYTNWRPRPSKIETGQVPRCWFYPWIFLAKPSN